MAKRSKDVRNGNKSENKRPDFFSEFWNVTRQLQLYIFVPICVKFKYSVVNGSCNIHFHIAEIKPFQFRNSPIIKWLKSWCWQSEKNQVTHLPDYIQGYLILVAVDFYELFSLFDITKRDERRKKPSHLCAGAKAVCLCGRINVSVLRTIYELRWWKRRKRAES